MSQFEDFAESLPITVAVYNIQSGEYHFVSKEMESLIGYKPEEIKAGGLKLVQSLIHPEDLEQMLAENEKAADYIQRNPELIKKHWADFKYRLKHKKGHWVSVHTRGRAYSLDDLGQVEKILNFTFDSSKANEVDFKDLGKIALHSFDFFAEKLVGDLVSHIHVLEFVIDEMVASSMSVDILSPEELRESFHGQSLILSEVSSKLSNLMKDLKN